MCVIHWGIDMYCDVQVYPKTERSHAADHGREAGRNQPRQGVLHYAETSGLDSLRSLWLKSCEGSCSLHGLLCSLLHILP